jgi:hypothetical protein
MNARPWYRWMLVTLLALVAGAAHADGPTTQNNPPPIDFERARLLYQRQQRGETLTADDQTYLERAKAERQKQVAGEMGDIDLARARAIHEKEQRGETLTADERAYLHRAKAAMQRGEAAVSAPPLPPMLTGKDSTGLVPLTQLTGDQKYKGQDGGLYGGGRNQPPEAHLKAALAAASKVVPLDAGGQPAASGGKVVLMSIGMSNTTQEFSRFKQLADGDAIRSPSLVIVDAAQGGKDAAAWTNGGGKNAVWDEADRRLNSAGASPHQVQVIWIKQALAGPARLGEFPAHAKVLQEHIQTILTLAKSRYPNLRLAYLSSRIYAGYATTPLNPEPYAYESAFAVRGAIEDQIRRAGKVSYDSAPVALWGPYLWADGVKGREVDELVWKREDFGGDGTHPSGSGRDKVALLLLKFFKDEPTAKGWFSRTGAGD